MARWSILLAVAAAAASVVSIHGAAAAPSAGGASGAATHRSPGYFAVSCGFSHRNQDDPIVFPRAPGRSHDHT